MAPGTGISPDNPFADLVAKPAPGLQESPKTGLAEDVVRSGATGLIEGGIGLQATPAFIDDRARQGAQWVLAHLGISADQVDLSKMPSFVPTREQITSVVEKAAGAPLHQPETVPGEYARTAGQFVPNAIGGEGSLVRKGLQVAVPALATETAGQLARPLGPGAETSARVGAAIATGGRTAKSPAPTLAHGAAKLKAASKFAYMKADQSGLVAFGDSFGSMAIPLVAKLKDEGLDQTLTPKTWAAINRFVDVADQPKTIKELDTLRKVAATAAQSAEPADRRLGTLMIDRVDEYLDNLQPHEIAAGNAQEAAAALKEARSAWSAARKVETIDGMLERAGLRSGQFSVSGKENGLRTEFRQLALKITRDKREASRWSPEERKVIKSLGNMAGLTNILRTIGKLAPRSQLMLGGGVAAAGYSYGTGNPLAPGAAGVAYGLGEVGRLGALALTRRKVGQLNALALAPAHNALRPPSRMNALVAGPASLPVQNWLQREQ